MGQRSRGFGLLIYLAMVLGIVGAIGVMAYKVRQSGYDAAMLAVEEANAKHRKVQQARIEKAAEKLEDKREKARIIYRTINRDVDRIVVEYRDRPCLDDRGLRAANAALSGKGTASVKPDAPLPATQPAR